MDEEVGTKQSEELHVERDSSARKLRHERVRTGPEPAAPQLAMVTGDVTAAALRTFAIVLLAPEVLVRYPCSAHSDDEQKQWREHSLTGLLLLHCDAQTRADLTCDAREFTRAGLVHTRATMRRC